MVRRLFRTIAALGLTVPLLTTAGAGAATPIVGPSIIGGTTVDAATVPWTVALLQSSVANGYDAQFCGGTLINPSWVLTAAHCVVNTVPSATNVAWGISDLNAIGAGDRHGLSQVLVHPQYKSGESTSDVALLRLTTPIPGATTLALNSTPSFPAISGALDTYGWGNVLYPGTSYPNLLHGVSLQDLAGPSSTGSCGFYGGQYIGDHMVCSGITGGGKDACQGDSGGPLVGTIGTTRVLVGVTSFGNGCALNNYPGLWSRVSSYTDWIDQQINGPTTPRVHIGDATVTEGDTGNRTASFTVTISPAAPNPLTVPYATADGSAIGALDYVPKVNTLTFTAGQVAKTVSVAVKSDQVEEATKSFRVYLGAPGGVDGATLVNAWATGTIFDDDSSTANQLTVGDASAREGDNGSGTVTVRTQVALSHAAGLPFTVTYTTVVGSAGTRDYLVKSGTLAFSDTATTKTITLSLRREWIPEGDESFTVQLGTPTIGGVLVTRPTGTFTIVNDD